MAIKPWREVAIPHEDVRKGVFQESEFAADISRVHQGKAPPEYQDGQQFYARTFVTEGMALLLDAVVRRLAGHAADPVIQLQTAFGGGKTHTLLAVWHLARQDYPVSELAGLAPILDAAEVHDLPKARTAVLDGINLSVTEGKRHGDVHTRTVWGELAWQLGGTEGYALVAEADASATSPAKDTLIELLTTCSPCVLLMDELVAYYRQFEAGKTYPAGSFETNMTFIQALTEAVKAVPRAIVLASLPDSRNAGEGRGQSVLAELESYFRRLHKIWKPVTKDEAFNIVRRRLFDNIDDPLAMEVTCRAYADYYLANAAELPNETQEGRYLERMTQAYPIHPEIFDRLYEDWSTLERFQRTRGVLQLLAQVIYRLWKDGNSDLMIMPGALPLYDPAVRNKCLDYLPQGWDPVIDQDVDGEHSRPAFIEGRQPLIGKIQGARRVARALFLGSAPASGGRAHKGIDVGHLLLGVAQPGQPLGHYKDALRHLADQLNYINQEAGRYWLEITPNLRREAESRKSRFTDKDDVTPLLRERVQRVFGRQHGFAGIHVFTPAADVPDEYGTAPRLVVLPPGAPYRKGHDNPAEAAAFTILTTRGDQPRQKQNRLLFLVADFDSVSRLADQARALLAWSSIVSDAEETRLVLDNLQLRQAKKQREDADQSLSRLIRDTYRWLLNPFQEVRKGRLDTTIRWEAISVSPSAPNLAAEIEQKLREQEWLIEQWSPVHLARILEAWYLKDGTKEVEALKVWQDTCAYLYLPRLLNDAVFKGAIAAGLECEDFFGYASGKEDDRYLGFKFGQSGLVTLDGDSLFIAKVVAASYKAAQQASESTTVVLPGQQGSATTASPSSSAASTPMPTPSAPTRIAKHYFYGTVKLDPHKAKLEFGDIQAEVLQHFGADVDTEVTLTLEVQARSKHGFNDQVERIVRENARVLRFQSAEFEEGEG